MNLKGRYDMLRQATLQMVGLPTDNIEHLKEMAQHMQIPALTDADAAVSLLVLQTLIATHGGAPAVELHGIPGNCVTHRSAWRDALQKHLDDATAAPTELNDRSYWQHELNAFDRTFDILDKLAAGGSKFLIAKEEPTLPQDAAGIKAMVVRDVLGQRS